MSCRARETWRAALAAAAVGGDGLPVGPDLHDTLLAELPYAQVLPALDSNRLCPARVRLLADLSALDAGPNGLLYRWIWRHCLWPFDWRLPPAASTRGLSAAYIRAGIQHDARLVREPEALGELRGVRVVPWPGLSLFVLTIQPAECLSRRIAGCTPALEG